MNPTFMHRYFLRMVHLASSPRFGSFKHKVSLTFARVHRCPMI
jgi:hypothetical protein